MHEGKKADDKPLNISTRQSPRPHVKPYFFQGLRQGGRGRPIQPTPLRQGGWGRPTQPTSSHFKNTRPDLESEIIRLINELPRQQDGEPIEILELWYDETLTNLNKQHSLGTETTESQSGEPPRGRKNTAVASDDGDEPEKIFYFKEVFGVDIFQDCMTPIEKSMWNTIDSATNAATLIIKNGGKLNAFALFILACAIFTLKNELKTNIEVNIGIENKSWRKFISSTVTALITKSIIHPKAFVLALSQNEDGRFIIVDFLTKRALDIANIICQHLKTMS
jgi:hypothetical protein